MSRTMSATDVVYRAYVLVGYFSMKDDKPYLMLPGEFEYTERASAHGPYNTRGPARTALKRALNRKSMDAQAGREETEKYNKQIREENANPPAWRTHYSQQPERDYYWYVTDWGIETVAPSDWKRIEGK